MSDSNSEDSEVVSPDCNDKGSQDASADTSSFGGAAGRMAAALGRAAVRRGRQTAIAATIAKKNGVELPAMLARLGHTALEAAIEFDGIDSLRQRLDQACARSAELSKTNGLAAIRARAERVLVRRSVIQIQQEAGKRVLEQADGRVAAWPEQVQNEIRSVRALQDEVLGLQSKAASLTIEIKEDRSLAIAASDLGRAGADALQSTSRKLSESKAIRSDNPHAVHEPDHQESELFSSGTQAGGSGSESATSTPSSTPTFGSLESPPALEKPAIWRRRKSMKLTGVLISVVVIVGIAVVVIRLGGKANNQSASNSISAISDRVQSSAKSPESSMDIARLKVTQIEEVLKRGDQKVVPSFKQLLEITLALQDARRKASAIYLGGNIDRIGQRLIKSLANNHAKISVPQENLEDQLDKENAVLIKDIAGKLSLVLDAPVGRFVGGYDTYWHRYREDRLFTTKLGLVIAVPTYEPVRPSVLALRDQYVTARSSYYKARWDAATQVLASESPQTSNERTGDRTFSSFLRQIVDQASKPSPGGVLLDSFLPAKNRSEAKPPGTVAELTVRRDGFEVQHIDGKVVSITYVLKPALLSRYFKKVREVSFEPYNQFPARTDLPLLNAEGGVSGELSSAWGSAIHVYVGGMVNELCLLHFDPLLHSTSNRPLHIFLLVLSDLRTTRLLSVTVSSVEKSYDPERKALISACPYDVRIDSVVDLDLLTGTSGDLRYGLDKFDRIVQR